MITYCRFVTYRSCDQDRQLIRPTGEDIPLLASVVRIYAVAVADTSKWEDLVLSCT